MPHASWTQALLSAVSSRAHLAHLACLVHLALAHSEEQDLELPDDPAVPRALGDQSFDCHRSRKQRQIRLPKDCSLAEEK
mmetsp:Transcript_57312/g.90843  ORF Transcript_57312/g.90843 Transcript_57312/m.90843 type:complete len:80 (-) Transcript_57312:255-494(-)